MEGGRSNVIGTVVAARVRPEGVQIETQGRTTVMLDDPNVRILYSKKLSPIIHVGQYTLTTKQEHDAREVRQLADSINKIASVD